MPERSADWIKQAKRDLDSAKAQKEDGFYEWACFISQQASGKALKALLQKIGAEGWGHSAVELLRAVREKLDVPEELDESARRLDRFYIPARYPNGWPSGSPVDYLTERDAVDATDHSEKIVRFCDCVLAGQGVAPAEDPGSGRSPGEQPT